MTEHTSRIIVKNLPKRIDEKRLSAHFGAKGSITDVRLMHTQTGLFRRFAFIGYSCPREAASAVAYFNNTFIDTSRIEVYPAHSVGDSSIPRAWSKHSSGSSSHIETQKRLHAEQEARKKDATEKIRAEVEKKKAYLKSLYGGEANDLELEKFLSASRTKTQTRTWENDDETLKDELKVKKAKRVKVIPVVNKKPGGEGQIITKSHVTFSSEENEEAVSSDEEYQDFILNRSCNFDILNNDDDDEEEEVDTAHEDPEICADPTSAKPDLINETARLFVRNLSYSCSEQDLTTMFEPFGTIEEVHLSLSRESKRSKGYAYVKFAQPESALRAYQELDGSIFQGRLLHILPAEHKPESATPAANVTSYKEQKLAKQKAESSKDFNWNSFFVRSDTVLNAIASQLGVSKSDIMSPSSENLAIRLATAEAHLISDTKQYLESEGLDLTVFETERPPRSKNAVIIKNFPFEAERQEIFKLFSKFGPLGRTIFPPSKAVAIVEFLEANDAKTAFRALAYSKFHNSPLFLEYAPVGLFKDHPKAPQSTPISVSSSINEDSVPDEATGNTNDTLYVKNINFETSEDSLRRVFSPIGPLKSVSIPRKRDAKNGLQSMGFAFVQYNRSEHATLALDRLNGTMIDGHAIALKRSSPKVHDSNSESKLKHRKAKPHTDQSSTCLMVRNIPFEASEREVRELFRNFAQVKRVRVPRKFDGGHRGFGFVDFVNSQEASSAMASLAHTHLYGRHLVIEWANTDSEDLDLLRDKAARNINALATAQASQISSASMTEDAIFLEK